MARCWWENAVETERRETTSREEDISFVFATKTNEHHFFLIFKRIKTGKMSNVTLTRFHTLSYALTQALSRIHLRTSMHPPTHLQRYDMNYCPWQRSNASISKKQNNTGSTAKRSKKINDDEVEILLLEVQSRPPLWNFELPLVQRSKEIVSALWQDLIGDEHRGSVSERVEQREKWKFYKSCEFLRDSCLIRPTSSNMPDNVDVGEHDDHRNTSMNDSESAADKSEETDILDSLSRIADKICNESITPALPPPPSIDAIDNFMIGIGHQIRKLPEEFHFEVMMEIMNLVYNKEKQFYLKAIASRAASEIASLITFSLVINGLTKHNNSSNSVTDMRK
ncbi:Protein of unknown function [Cotesia congregata]|uniref:MADF domain-containing protein n=1 Tax=Cotesia congregata TaxID=51543 RepID=A0A8J2HRG4_COTCN|nr:Protein of unknown function [Cotesia congregata]